ncbi:hypothetical protein FA13DRAFT_1802895 [Coprinellus micaceus]|uniref:Uncharacterized protein n=1 Tax=Coprinellus micaceus TaxID=71717 RepID=A0A4Y7SBG9_COPMI|nr:hypothetical protein FA13DRAFT_1802895 [Coprinellus micaceus]
MPLVIVPRRSASPTTLRALVMAKRLSAQPRNTTVRELLKEVKEDTADKYAHDLTLLRIYRTIALGLDVDEDKLAPQAAQYH